MNTRLFWVTSTNMLLFVLELCEKRHIKLACKSASCNCLSWGRGEREEEKGCGMVEMTLERIDSSLCFDVGSFQDHNTAYCDIPPYLTTTKVWEEYQDPAQAYRRYKTHAYISKISYISIAHAHTLTLTNKYEKEHTFFDALDPSANATLEICKQIQRTWHENRHCPDQWGLGLSSYGQPIRCRRILICSWEKSRGFDDY